MSVASDFPSNITTPPPMPPQYRPHEGGACQKNHGLMPEVYLDGVKVRGLLSVDLEEHTETATTGIPDRNDRFPTITIKIAAQKLTLKGYD